MKAFLSFAAVLLALPGSPALARRTITLTSVATSTATATSSATATATSTASATQVASANERERLASVFTDARASLLNAYKYGFTGEDLKRVVESCKSAQKAARDAGVTGVDDFQCR